MLAAVVAAGGCSGPGEPVPSHDLLALFDSAETGGSPEGGSRARTSDGLLYLPAGERVDYYLRLPPGSLLKLAGVRPRGRPGGPLEVVIQRDGGAREETLPLEAGPGPREIPLPGGGSELARLSFVTGGADGDGEGADGYAILEPWVWSPQHRAAREGRSRFARARKPASGPRPNVIFYLPDTLRADHLGIYGYQRPVTPHLDDFAGGATVYEQAVAQAPWTRPSVASVMTGLSPHQHGVATRGHVLAQAHLTLAELLAGAGYSTAAVITNPIIGRKFGFDQGFDLFVRLRGDHAGSEEVTARALELLRSGRLPEPFFLYLHTLDPHAPYAAPAPFRERFAPGVDPERRGSVEVLKQFRRKERVPLPGDVEEIRDLYDAEVARNDASFGGLLAGLKEMGLYERSAIVFLSDHGEELWDHGSWGHGHTLYGELLRMPLVVKAPGQTAPRRVAELVQQVDLLPTALAWAGVPIPAGLPGQPLDEAAAAGRGSPRPGYSALDQEGRHGVSIQEGEWKLVLPRSQRFGSFPALYHLPSDPGEMENLATEHPVVVGYLTARLRELEAAPGPGFAPTEAPLTEEMRKELQALGYLD